MVEKFIEIEQTVADVIRMQNDIPADKLPPEAVAYYTLMARGAPISGEIVRYLLTEANKGTPTGQAVHSVIEIVCMTMHNLLVVGSERMDGDDPELTAAHNTVHRLLNDFNEMFHRNLDSMEGRQKGQYIVSEEVRIKRKEVGDA